MATFFIYIRCGSEIYRKRRQLRKADSSSHGGHDLELSKFEEAIIAQTTVTTEVHVMSESASQSSQQTAVDLRDIEAKAGSASNAYSINISSGRRDGPAPIVAPTNAPQSKPKTKKKASNDAAWAYTKVAVVFFTALLVTWIPSSANRVFSLVHTGQTVVALEILSAIVLPLQGFWNAIIYCVTSWAAVKLFFSEVSHRASHGNSPADFGSQQKERRDLSFNFSGRGNKGSEDSDSMTELAGNAIPMSKSP